MNVTDLTFNGINELKGQALKDMAKELNVPGRGSMKADELRTAIRDLLIAELKKQDDAEALDMAPYNEHSEARACEESDTIGGETDMDLYAVPVTPVAPGKTALAAEVTTLTPMEDHQAALYALGHDRSVGAGTELINKANRKGRYYVVKDSGQPLKTRPVSRFKGGRGFGAKHYAMARAYARTEGLAF